MSITAEEQLKILEGEREKLTLRIGQLRSLLKQYPDLGMSRDRWGKEVVFSNSLRSRDDLQYLIKNNCGCCSDSPKELWAYITLDDGKTLPISRVYTESHNMFIGVDATGYRTTPHSEFVEKLRKKGYSEKFIEKLSYLDKG